MKGVAVAIGVAAFLLAGAPALATEMGGINPTVARAWNGVAPCLSPDRQTDEAIAAKLDALAAGAPRTDAVVAGFALTDQPEPLIAAFRQITRRMPRQARGPVSTCHDVGCAVRALLGAEEGPRLLLLAARYRFNASHLGEYATRSWTAAELDQLIAAFEDMPPSLFPLEYRALVYRRHAPHLVSSQAMFELAAEAGHGQPGIVVAQGWHRVGLSERRAIIVHELAHEFVRAHGRGIGWNQGWRAAVEADSQAEGLSLPSAYAGQNLGEDFAESVAAYRYMAPLLKNRAPHRYAFLREHVFGGLEYGSAAKCAR